MLQDASRRRQDFLKRGSARSINKTKNLQIGLREIKKACALQRKLLAEETTWRIVVTEFEIGLISRIYKELKTSSSNRPKSPVNKWANGKTDTSQKMKYKCPVNI